MADSQFTTEELTTEEWRPVVGWEGRYEVSSLGRVKSLRFRHHVGVGFMSPCVMGRYLGVKLGASKEHASVHSLVAQSFIGPRPVLHDGREAQINHIDGVKTNNRRENLEYVTCGENVRHAVATGLFPIGDRHYTALRPERVARGDKTGRRLHPESYSGLIGAGNTNAVLTATDVVAIRRALVAGEFQRDVAARFGVSQSTIWQINTRKTWGHVP